MGNWFLIEDINPTPWTAPSVSSGQKNGSNFVRVYKNAELTSYQEAIKEDLFIHYTEFPMYKKTPLSLAFFFWRQLPVYSGDSRQIRKHQVDATNLQKATEDALQGVLFDNDRDVVTVESTIMEQSATTDPAILIYLEPAAIPEWAQSQRNSILAERGANKSKEITPRQSRGEHDPF